MRKATLVFAILAAACASNTGGGHNLRVRVTEVQSGMQDRPLAGDHYFRVYVQNASTEPITVHQIRVDSSGVSSLEATNPSETFDQEVGAGETGTFDMMVSLIPTAGSRAGAMMSTGRIGSLRVTIVGRGAQGDFMDSGDYSVGFEMQ